MSTRRTVRIYSDIAYGCYFCCGMAIVVILALEKLPSDTAGLGIVVGIPLLLSVLPVGAVGIVMTGVQLIQRCIPREGTRHAASVCRNILSEWPLCTLAVFTFGSVVLYGVYVMRPEHSREAFWPVVVTWSSVWLLLAVVLPLVWFLLWRRQCRAQQPLDSSPPVDQHPPDR